MDPILKSQTKILNLLDRTGSPACLFGKLMNDVQNVMKKSNKYLSKQKFSILNHIENILPRPKILKNEIDLESSDSTIKIY